MKADRRRLAFRRADAADDGPGSRSRWGRWRRRAPGSLPIYGNVNVLSKIFNPDLAVIGNFQGVAGTNSVESSPAFEMREVETSFQAVVDPYARADFFVAFGARRRG